MFVISPKSFARVPQSWRANAFQLQLFVYKLDVVNKEILRQNLPLPFSTK